MPKVWKKRNLRVTADGRVMERVDEPSEEASPKQPRVVEAPQGNRVQIKLTSSLATASVRDGAVQRRAGSDGRQSI